MSPRPLYDIDAVRRRIPLLQHTVPMNNCSQSPQMDITRAAAEEYLESWNIEGMDWERWMVEVEASRISFSRLINASPDEVSARAAMDFLADTGLDAIQAWTEELSRALVEGGKTRGCRLLGTEGPTQKAPTTAFLVPGDPHAIEAELRDRGVLASARGPAIRLAPHFYSTLQDVETALDALAEVLGTEVA